MTFQSDLDQMLRSDGQEVILRRVVGTTVQTSVDCTCMAFVRGYRPDELVGVVIQGDSEVIISATDIIAAQWPGGEPVQSPPVATDPRVPRKGDKVIIAGRVRNVEAAAPIYIANELHRINIQARG